MTTTQKELLILLVLTAIFLLALIPSLIEVRTLTRDDLRQQDMAHLKRAIEDYYNKHEYYVTSPSADTACTRSDDMQSWFFGKQSVLLKEKIVSALPHDLREQKGFAYRYCVTSLANGKTTGYFLEAQFEGTRYKPGSGFDEDEYRKYHFLIQKDQNQILYRVCGGTDLQCQ